MACQSRRSLGLDIFIHEMYLIQTTKVNSKLCNYVNPSVSKAGNCSWKSKSRIASYISQRKPIWNTSRKIPYFKLYKCYFLFCFFLKKLSANQGQVSIGRNNLSLVDTKLKKN